MLFIIMRLVDGTDLRALIDAQGQIDPLRAARIVRQVGAALDAAHARGMLHPRHQALECPDRTARPRVPDRLRPRKAGFCGRRADPRPDDRRSRRVRRRYRAASPASLRCSRRHLAPGCRCSRASPGSRRSPGTSGPRALPHRRPAADPQDGARSSGAFDAVGQRRWRRTGPAISVRRRSCAGRRRRPAGRDTRSRIGRRHRRGGSGLRSDGDGDGA